MAKYKTQIPHDISIFSEPAAVYPTVGLSQIANSILFGSDFKIPEYQMVSFDKMKILKVGLSKSNLEKFKQKAALDYDKLAQALAVTRATLINNNGTEKYSSTVTERILALTDLYSYGYKVFGEESKFNDWMFKPNKAIGDKPPFDIVDNQFGREEIKNILGRIEFGVYS